MPRGRPRKNPDDMLLKSAEFIGWAIGGLEREIVETKNRLAALTAQAAKLRGRIGAQAASAAVAASATTPADGPVAAEEGRKRRRRRMSPEARKRISEMMKKRWAEKRKK
jgi:hypothetical protein